jgi:hypothetical protein
MKDIKIRPNDIRENGAEKRERTLNDLIKKAKEKGLIHSIKNENSNNNNTEESTIIQ